DLIDVRRPPEDLTVSRARARDADADVVLTVGTDCSTGKMTTTLELVAAARARGVDAGFVPTGQTGIMIAGWGVPVDRTIAAFAAGGVERMIIDAAEDHDVLFVEGQGTIVHPAYSGVTCSLLHGAMPDSLVLTHSAGRETIHGYEEFSIPPVEAYVDLYEDLAAPVASAEVVAGALDTRALDDDEAACAAVDDYADAVGGPATDPVRFGAGDILGALL
ncbi:MAG: NAD-dependent epimerase/dehydratase family protein, partial [Haloplanus sp.]